MPVDERSLGAGFRVGHWTDEGARTGCTVILPPPGNVASADIRGSSPSSRELVMLHTNRRLTEIHALLFTGGSAFGLAAADGVVGWLAERGIGYQTGVALVPIVPAAVIFDLANGRADVRPGPTEGRAACDAASETGVPTGGVGAGTGATVGKWAGRAFGVPGGLGIGHAAAKGLEVSALAVVNSVGDVLGTDGSILAGTRAPDPQLFPEAPPLPDEGAPGNTVLCAVTTRAGVEKRDARWLAARGADGVTVSIRPAHTRYDGDVAIAIVAPPEEGSPPGDLDVLGALATEAVATAVRNAVVSVTPPA